MEDKKDWINSDDYNKLLKEYKKEDKDKYLKKYSKEQLNKIEEEITFKETCEICFYNPYENEYEYEYNFPITEKEIENSKW